MKNDSGFETQTGLSGAIKGWIGVGFVGGEFVSLLIAGSSLIRADVFVSKL